MESSKHKPNNGMVWLDLHTRSRWRWVRGPGEEDDVEGCGMRKIGQRGFAL